MSKHAGTIVGAVLLTGLVMVVLATQGTHSGHNDVVVSIAAASPTPSAAPSVLTSSLPSGSTTPHPAQASAWDQAIGATAHGTLIAWLVALGILPLFALVGIALHARYRSKLLELEHPPLRQPELTHRAYDVKALEARRGWLPESFTYSPHLRQDTAEVVEESPQLNGPLPSAEALVAMPGLAYGVRVDDGQPLIDHEIRSLLVGGQMGAGKSTLVALLGAQLHQMGARLVVGDPHASNPQGLSARMRTLIDRFDLEQEPRLIFHRVMEAWSELERRERLGDPRGLPPYVVIVDEFAELLRRLDDRDEERLRDALLLIGGLSGRKFKVATIVMSQSWKHSVVRSTEMRDLVSTQAVFRMRKDEALRMTNLGSDYWNPDPLLLQKGEAFIVGVLSGAVLVRVPPVEAPTRAHAELPPTSGHFPAASALLPPTSGPASGEPSGSAWEVDGKRPGSAPEAGAEALSEAVVISLFRQGHSVGQIVRKLTGQKGGRAFQRGHDEVLAIIRRQMPAGEDS